MAKKKQRSNASAIIIRVIAIILFIVGSTLIFNKPIVNQMIRHNQTSALSGLTRKQIKQNQKKKGMYDFAKVKSMGITQATRSQIKNTSGAIGALAIPNVNMYLLQNSDKKNSKKKWKTTT